MQTIWLSWQEQQDLYQFAASITQLDDENLYHDLPKMREFAKKILTEKTIEGLSTFARNDAVNILRINGLPIDRCLPKTPSDGYINNTEIPIASVAQMMIFSLSGISPIAYNRENKGQLFRHVVPTKALETRASSHGTCTLDMHVSNPILPIIPEETNGVSGSPEILSLYGIRQSAGVYTEVIELDDVLAILPAEIIDALQRKHYYFRMPSSFGEGGLKGPFSVIAKGSNGLFYNRTDMDTAIPVDYNAMKALSIFLEATRKVKQLNKLILAPGDMLLFKNQRTLHSRKKYKAQHNGLDRWMVRLYGTVQPHRHHSVSKEKPYIGFTYTEGVV